MVWNEVVKRQPRASAILRAARPSGPSVAMCSASGTRSPSTRQLAAGCRHNRRSGSEGAGMVRLPSGLTTVTSWPHSARILSMVVQVRTTPLTCGCQASVTRTMRMMRPEVVDKRDLARAM